MRVSENILPVHYLAFLWGDRERWVLIKDISERNLDRENFPTNICPTRIAEVTWVARKQRDAIPLDPLEGRRFVGGGKSFISMEGSKSIRFVTGMQIRQMHPLHSMLSDMMKRLSGYSSCCEKCPSFLPS
ncbi:hypothetical protein CDAR_590911 [Caerostris darwini]|uniref:Ycf15 n=1 Tax=Caerostris darwini TaxID=1538125 RepID=A0AAV4SJ71_9ARAC|nr:hypothetical protein CDAR_590911 [Caerostris darwini]